MSGMRFTLEQLNPNMRRQAEAKLALSGTVRVVQPDQVSRSNGNNKFYAQAVSADGKRFDSKKEYAEYLKLVAREAAGEISELRVQVKFSLFDPGGACRGEHIGTYRADFVYRENGRLVVADAKSEKTRKLRDWPRTKKLMRACHRIEILEL